MQSLVGRLIPAGRGRQRKGELGERWWQWPERSLDVGRTSLKSQKDEASGKG